MDAALFIRRPVLAIVLSLVILLMGGVAFTLLPVRETPDVQSPVVTVSTAWPGADPALVETQVTEVLEKQLNGIEGVRQITSTSQDQNSTITVEFELGRDLEAAANDVRSRVSRARRQLPDDADEPVVEKADSNAQPVMFLRVTSETRSLLELNEIADTLVRERLQSATGVSGVDIFGEQRFAMRVELDPARMAARNLTPSDIETAFRAQNVDLPAGRVEGQRVDLGIRLDGGFRTPEEFSQMILTDTGAGLVRLGDVATVRLGAANERQAARADGEAAVTLAITPQANANIIELSDAVRARLPQVQADLPPDVELVEQYDRSEAVRASIAEVEETLLIAFGLVVLVIFAFLRDWRSTLVPTLAIPVSIIGTFFALWVFGFSINVFTLFGLVLAIGLVVDDAIVVLENIYRRMEEGEPTQRAASEGTRQIQFAVIATTISLIAVFLPVIFTGGTSGKLFVEFGTTVAVAVAISAVVALTLTPMLCAALLRPAGAQRGAFYRASEQLLQGLNRVFAWSLRLTLRQKWLVIPLVLGSIVAGVAGYQVLPREFFPLEDRNIFFMRLVAPEGTTYEYLDERMRALEPMLMEAVPERRSLLSRVAQGVGGSVGAGNSGTFVFPLVSADQRTRSQQDIVNAVRGLMAKETAFNAIPIQFPTVGRSFASPLQIVLLHPDFEQLASTLPRAVAAMRQVPGLSAVNEDLKLNRPELRAVVDREKAAAAGLSVRDMARALQLISAGLDVSDFKRGTRQYDVYASLPRELRDTPEALRVVSLRARDGSMVPLGNYVSFSERAAASSRYHFDRTPSATISANLDGITLGEGIERAKAAVQAELGEGFRIALAGESRDFADASSSLLGIFGLALLLVYLTLAAQFNSFIDPVSILLAVPLALTGAFISLAILGMSLSFFSQVGLILLVGLVTKNGILIVEYAHQLMETEHLDLWAAAEKATLLRFRPILMTSIATIGGALPIALGFSGSSRAPLGVAVVGGMVVATVLTLYVVPVVWGLLARRPAPGAVVTGVTALLLGLILPTSAQAEELTLSEALRRALTDNRDLAAASADLDGTLAAVGMVRAGVLPSLTGSATALVGVDPSRGFGGDGELGKSGTAGVVLSVPLLDLAAWGDLRAVSLGFDAATAGYDAQIEATLASVAGVFLSLQAAEASRVAAEAALTRDQRLLTLARDRAAVGLATPIEVTRAELQVRRDEAKVASTGAAASRARLALTEALALPAQTPIDVVTAAPLIAPDAIPATADLDAALDHPSLRAARSALDAATASRRAIRLDQAPSLDAFGTAGVVTGFTGTTAPYTTAGLTATVPLIAGGYRAAANQGAAADEAYARINLESTEATLVTALYSALATLRAAAATLQAATAAQALAEDELSFAEDRYRAGAASQVELVDAQSRLIEVTEDAISALSTYNVAVIGWYQAQGRLRALAGP